MMDAVRIIKQVPTHPYLALVFRLYLAGLFIYAGMYKINYAAEFAETIASYRLIPFWGVNLMAVALPWVELVCGILLAAGIRTRSATAIIGALLTVFTLGILVNLLRDAPISCGCFHTVGDTISWWTFFRDAAWVAMSLHIFFFDNAFQLERAFSFRLKEI